jgi:nitrile hydratase accessory protein
MRHEEAPEARFRCESRPQHPVCGFAEPWQARAFAIAVLASGQGCFTWSEWSHALGRELRQASRIGADSEAAAYFDCWLAALQSLFIGKGAVGHAELRERRQAWEDAYRRTPHGAPVSLSAPWVPADR